MEDYGKVRVYQCENCGLAPVRPLHGDPKACDHCLFPLGDKFQIEDRLRLVERIIAGEAG